MTSVAELRALLTQANDEADAASARLESAWKSLNEAIQSAGTVNPHHPELVVPPQFIEAEQRIKDIIVSLAQTNETLRNYTAQL